MRKLVKSLKQMQCLLIRGLELGGNMTKGNIYHDSFELTIQDIKFRVKEMEKEEKENKDNHLTYQSLLKFFYDVRSIINTKETP
jgi:hypothetical protein